MATVWDISLLKCRIRARRAPRLHYCRSWPSQRVDRMHSGYAIQKTLSMELSLSCLSVSFQLSINTQNPPQMERKNSCFYHQRAMWSFIDLNSFGTQWNNWFFQIGDDLQPLVCALQFVIFFLPALDDICRSIKWVPARRKWTFLLVRCAPTAPIYK